MKRLIDIVNFIEKEFPSLSDAERWKLLKILLDGHSYVKNTNRDLKKAKRLKIILGDGTQMEVGPGKYATVLKALGVDYREIEKEKNAQGLKTKIDPKTYLISHADELGIKIIPNE